MLPWKSLINLDRLSPSPVYLQMANGIIHAIQEGILKPNIKLPGTREMSRLFHIHRNTVVQAYHELESQGWVVSQPHRGTFIHPHIPVQTPLQVRRDTLGRQTPPPEQINFRVNAQLHSPRPIHRDIPGFHDGPDTRLAPVMELSRAYRRVLDRQFGWHNLSYVDGEGKPLLRQVLAEDMNLSRGMHTAPENVFITRGSQMAIYMLSRVLLQEKDLVIVGDVDYYYACQAFVHAGAELLKVTIDAQGIDTDEIESWCRTRKIRAVYVTPHHHYPTTVTLSMPRRMKLLALAEQYGFIILEDDYDFAFHYSSHPILPLASADRHDRVIYIGTLSKTLAPAFRLGYVSAPEPVVQELARLRQIIDIQGDPLLEQAIAEMFVQGEIRRHLKKALKAYETRRDLMCRMLRDRLNDIVSFQEPQGGLAIWARFDPQVRLPELSQKLRQKNIILSSGEVHDDVAGRTLHSTRMGFGWMNPQEAEHAVDILYKTIHSR